MEQPLRRKKIPLWKVFVIIIGCYAIYYYVKNNPPDSSTQSKKTYVQSEKENIKILSHNTKKSGAGIWVYVQIKNESSKTLKYVGIEVSWYDRNGNILESHTCTQTEVDPYETAIVDGYFDEKPSGATYKIRVEDVTYY